jgi:hypothetical protein
MEAMHHAMRRRPEDTACASVPVKRRTEIGEKRSTGVHAPRSIGSTIIGKVLFFKKKQKEKKNSSLSSTAVDGPQQVLKCAHPVIRLVIQVQDDRLQKFGGPV